MSAPDTLMKTELMEQKTALTAKADVQDLDFYYGDFLFRQHRYGASETALQTALRAPPIARRELGDQGVRRDAADLLAQGKHRRSR